MYSHSVIYKNLPELEDDNVKTTTEYHDVEYIDKEEVDYILKNFVEYINSKTQYSFYILEVGKVTLKISSSENEISKKYNIPFFIHDASKNFSKRLVADFYLNRYIHKKGDIIVDNIVLPKEYRISSLETILPPATDPFLINTITNGRFTKLRDKLDLSSAYNSDQKYTLLTEEDLKKEKERKENIEKIRKEFSCYGIPQSQEIGDKLECINFGGVWDRPPETQEECPFYEANKNYFNTKGGLKNDYCEMPSGVKIKGYRFYNNNPQDYNPLCYNCKTDLIGQGTLGTCCEKQKQDKKTYSKLKSPDYKFPGDYADRVNSKRELEYLQLSVE